VVPRLCPKLLKLVSFRIPPSSFLHSFFLFHRSQFLQSSFHTFSRFLHTLKSRKSFFVLSSFTETLPCSFKDFSSTFLGRFSFVSFLPSKILFLKGSTEKVSTLKASYFICSTEKVPPRKLVKFSLCRCSFHQESLSLHRKVPPRKFPPVQIRKFPPAVSSSLEETSSSGRVETFSGETVYPERNFLWWKLHWEREISSTFLVELSRWSI
jgi:hypothetical protein